MSLVPETISSIGNMLFYESLPDQIWLVDSLSLEVAVMTVPQIQQLGNKGRSYQNQPQTVIR